MSSRCLWVCVCVFCQGLFLGFLQFEIDKHDCMFFLSGSETGLRPFFIFIFIGFLFCSLKVASCSLCVFCQGLKLDPGLVFCSLKVAIRCVYILSGSETGPRPIFLQFESCKLVRIYSVRV